MISCSYDCVQHFHIVSGSSELRVTMRMPLFHQQHVLHNLSEDLKLILSIVYLEQLVPSLPNTVIMSIHLQMT